MECAITSTRLSVEVRSMDQTALVASIAKANIPACGRGITHPECFALIESPPDGAFVLHAFECQSSTEVCGVVDFRIIN